jgi:hypothetical protein
MSEPVFLLMTRLYLVRSSWPRALGCLLGAILVALTRNAVLAQAAADGWSGQIECVINVRAAGYQDDQMQTWTITGAAVPRNDFRDYPAAWTVMGSGSRAPADAWTRTGSDANGSITLFVPIGTNNIRVAPGQRVLKAVGGIRATAASIPVTGDADEWRGYQYFDAPGAATQTAFNGSRTQMRTDLVGWRQPAGASVTETCTWNFAKGTVARIGVLATQPTLTSQSGATAGTGTQVTLSPAGSTTTIQQVDTPATVTGTLANETLASGTRTGMALNAATASLLGPAPRTITLAGFTAVGTATAVAPRTITLTGFTAAGASTAVAPRTITLTGFTAAGPATSVAPRTITLPGWTAAGP